MDIAAHQPDGAGNVGALIRTSACFGARLHIIEPCGFPFSVKAVRRSALDYADRVDIHRHDSWDAWRAARGPGRLILLTTKGAEPLWDVRFAPGDVLMLGSESAGAPDHVHDAADLRAAIPMAEGARTLNIAVAAGVALGLWAAQKARAGRGD